MVSQLEKNATAAADSWVSGLSKVYPLDLTGGHQSFGEVTVRKVFQPERTLAVFSVLKGLGDILYMAPRPSGFTIVCALRDAEDFIRQVPGLKDVSSWRLVNRKTASVIDPVAEK